jgi:hypothetical protein
MKTYKETQKFTKNGVFVDFIARLKALASTLPDPRTGRNITYPMRNIVLGAFSVFFLQWPSFLSWQQSMEKRAGRSNAETLFQIEAVPCDQHIRDMLDPIAPDHFYPEFHNLWRAVVTEGHVKAYQVLGGHHILLSLDGIQYFSSYALECANCSHAKRRNGKVQHFHTAVLSAVVAPDNPQVIAGPPEFIMPQDGHTKQDCEQAASKRWLNQHLDRYAPWNPIVMGDDLYAHQPLCEQIRDQDGHFLFGCKPDSHVILYKTLAAPETEVTTRTIRKWDGQHSVLWTYRFCNDVPLRAGEDALRVNWFELHITRYDTGKTCYHHTWITDLPVTEDNIAELVRCGRAHWKIENENNNVLKNHGYQLEHNFGHGDQYLALTLLTLMLLAFLLHTVIHLSNPLYRRLRKDLGRRVAFFNDLRALLRYHLFESWSTLLHFMAVRLEVLPGPL